MIRKSRKCVSENGQMLEAVLLLHFHPAFSREEDRRKERVTPGCPCS